MERRRQQQQPPNEASSYEEKKRSSDGISSSSERKKLKKSKNKDRVPRILTSQEAAVLVPLALIPLIETGFLDTKDLGRLLLRTCKAMTAAGLDEESDTVWNPLCKSYWGTEKAKTLLESVEMSPEICFREFAVMDDPKEFEGLRPLQYTPRDYVFIVSIKEHETGRPILSETIRGQDISRFFDNGNASVTFKKPLYEKEVDRSSPFLNSFVRVSVPRMSLEWDGTLHILRRPDQRMERLMKHEGRTDHVNIESNDDGSEELLLDSRRRFVYPHSGVTDHYGKALFEHYGCYDLGGLNGFEIDFGIEWGRSGTNSVGIFGFNFYSNVQTEYAYAYSGRDEPFGEAMEGKDVTLAHFLEAVMK